MSVMRCCAMIHHVFAGAGVLQQGFLLKAPQLYQPVKIHPFKIKILEIRNMREGEE